MLTDHCKMSVRKDTKTLLSNRFTYIKVCHFTYIMMMTDTMSFTFPQP